MSMLIEASDGNLQFVAWNAKDNTLTHWWRNGSDPSQSWQGPTATISTKATGPGCIIQSTYGTPTNPGNFEVVVPEGNNLVHYYRDNTAAGQPWKGPIATISTKATGPASLIQSTYGTPKDPGNFELVVPEGSNLVHYFRDNNPALDPSPWHGPTVITDQATGPGALIQSTYTSSGSKYGNFEVVAPVGGSLIHFYRDNSSGKWIEDATIMAGGTWPSLIQSSYGTPENPGNFEVITISQGNLVHWYRDNTTGMKWASGGTVCNSADGPNALIQSNYGGSPGNFEVITNNSGNYTYYYRDNSNPQMPWSTGKVITSEAGDSVKDAPKK
ncbi:hypothetical protein Asppvi_008419 [Aspergillus pseudoviridinutans]|uniref:Fucose-specific lectin n=1 Tax=Aspergillus pseudoviridinutans TaxID=1517512 RepID=A0A9P3BDM6_9EURO|nr:uncharacterized protein Asppvi_008419 [Aspergillus pseudoviridinutans]GIJ89477.1 hypothetical protein Asppvi_008419 [Aspergillus pseudoviridinutans]